MKMLRWMSDHTRLDNARNESIRGKVGVVPIEDKLREERLRQFDHIKRRHTKAPIRQVEHIELEDRKKRRGRPKLTLRKVVQYNLEVLHISKDLTQNRLKWRKRIHITDSNKFLG